MSKESIKRISQRVSIPALMDLFVQTQLEEDEELVDLNYSVVGPSDVYHINIDYKKSENSMNNVVSEVYKRIRQDAEEQLENVMVYLDTQIGAVLVTDSEGRSHRLPVGMLPEDKVKSLIHQIGKESAIREATRMIVPEIVKHAKKTIGNQLLWSIRYEAKNTVNPLEKNPQVYATGNFNVSWQANGKLHEEPLTPSRFAGLRSAMDKCVLHAKPISLMTEEEVSELISIVGDDNLDGLPYDYQDIKNNLKQRCRVGDLLYEEFEWLNSNGYYHGPQYHFDMGVVVDITK